MEKTAEWRERNPERRRSQARREHARRAFGLDAETYEAYLALPCAICGSESEVLDHDHSTGRIRGPLCNRCNWALGHLRDNPALARAAADFVEAHS